MCVWTCATHVTFEFWELFQGSSLILLLSWTPLENDKYLSSSNVLNMLISVHAGLYSFSVSIRPLLYEGELLTFSLFHAINRVKCEFVASTFQSWKCVYYDFQVLYSWFYAALESFLLLLFEKYCGYFYLSSSIAYSYSIICWRIQKVMNGSFSSSVHLFCENTLENCNMYYYIKTRGNTFSKINFHPFFNTISVSLEWKFHLY